MVELTKRELTLPNHPVLAAAFDAVTGGFSGFEHFVSVVAVETADGCQHSEFIDSKITGNA